MSDFFLSRSNEIRINRQTIYKQTREINWVQLSPSLADFQVKEISVVRSLQPSLKAVTMAAITIVSPLGRTDFNDANHLTINARFSE
jgi:hypothetical protein